MDEKTLIYYQLFEKLINAMTSGAKFNRQEFVDILSEICELFHIAKGVTEFYTSLSQEKAGQGEILIDYDNGRGDKVVVRRRLVTNTMAVIIGTLYMSSEDEPLSNEDYVRVDLILRALLSFVSRNRLQKAVEMLGYYDDNGYPNQRSYLRYMEQVNEEGRLSAYTAMHFNLRHFTLINGDVGRSAGDVVMRNYFNRIKDVIGDEGILCRMGGDNFVAIFRDHLLEQVLEIIKGIPVPYDPAGEKRVNVSANAGVYVIPEGTVFENVGDIINRIMIVSALARKEEEGSVIFYDDRMMEVRDRSMRIQRLFPGALAAGEFKVFYQPKVHVDTGRIVGAEALCRWFRDGKIVPPMDFIPVLEQTMDICQLDFYMLDCVCKDICRWLAEGKPVVRVSVNLSRKHLTDADLLEHIMAVIDRNQTPHQYIEIELTETTTDVEFKDLKRVVHGLQEEGVYTSVDDFGIGYSSLNLIREIPWNVLKIDRCFLPMDETGEAGVTGLMFKHVISMAQEMGLDCIVEGVETSRQIDILRENNCHIAQGFYFDKPLSVEEFERRMDRLAYDVPEYHAKNLQRTKYLQPPFDVL
ncbi:MAG: EAL domain-containing protein [Lachnospiraceae bacterium]|nr:EAL domain-containing protein [Lachnospiraceae bacterium]